MYWIANFMRYLTLQQIAQVILRCVDTFRVLCVEIIFPGSRTLRKDYQEPYIQCTIGVFGGRRLCVWPGYPAFK
jgi:hypothetical protein